MKFSLTVILCTVPQLITTILYHYPASPQPFWRYMQSSFRLQLGTTTQIWLRDTTNTCIMKRRLFKKKYNNLTSIIVKTVLMNGSVELARLAIWVWYRDNILKEYIKWRYHSQSYDLMLRGWKFRWFMTSNIFKGGVANIRLKLISHPIF